jgi:uncharacterized protein
MTIGENIDRNSIRRRPGGMPVMYQSWCKLLFMHWRLPPELLRSHVPEQLEIDTYQGDAWIGVTPFTVRDARPVFVPPLPLLSDFHEINVRTYVHFNGIPGVWFFSLDASSLLAVLGASALFHLPYHTADMTLKERGDEIFYTSRRVGGSGNEVRIETSWRKGEMLGEAQLNSLEFFLVERYCLYALHDSSLYRARIFHDPWQLQGAQLLSCKSTMMEGQQLPRPAGIPLVHYSERQETAVWPLHKIA